MTGRLAVVAIALAVGAAPLACDGGEQQARPDPSPPTTTSTTVTTIDYTAVGVAAIDSGGSTTTTAPPKGEAVLAGRVLGDSGAPVAGAIVRATYYGAPERPEVIEVATGEDGGYRLEQLRGGRWRIRAWLPPTLASVEMEPIFLGHGEQRTLDARVHVVPDIHISTSMAPNPPLLGDPAQLAVLVVSQRVDSDGNVVRKQVAKAPIELRLSGGWTYTYGSESENVTDRTGTARWALICGAEGALPIRAVMFGEAFKLTVPSCLSPQSTTTTTKPTTSTTGKRRRSAATQPGPDTPPRRPIGTRRPAATTVPRG